YPRASGSFRLHSRAGPRGNSGGGAHDPEIFIPGRRARIANTSTFIDEGNNISMAPLLAKVAGKTGVNICYIQLSSGLRRVSPNPTSH
ncbi:MAG: hypothetical protein N2B03_06235, partial [Boseongicola sp.]